MKIALVTPFALGQHGGVAEHVFHLRREFQRLGHEATIIAPRSGASTTTSPERDGVHEIGRTITLPTNGSHATLTFDLTRYREVRRLIRRERFDVIHVHAPLTPALTWMALFASDTVNVATFHAYRDGSAWYRVLAPLFRPILRRLDARVAVSEPARAFVSRSFPGDYTIVPNGIDLDRFNPEVSPFSWAGNPAPRILFVGRHDEPRKGLSHLLRAMPAVRAAVPGTRLIVVGQGDQSIHGLTLSGLGSDGIEFIGVASPDDLPRLAASCDVLCAPSTGNESFGIVLLEAMASGTPVVATDIPGYASVITSEHNGLLVPANDSQRLSIALVRVLTDPMLRSYLQDNGQRTAERYAWPGVAAQVMAVYERALGGDTR